MMDEHARIAGRAAKMSKAALAEPDSKLRAGKYANAYTLMRLAYEKATDQVAEGE